MVAWGLGPSPSAELALGAWAEAKVFLQAQMGRLPEALVHHDQGGSFLSHEWVGTLLLRDGQRLSYSLMGAKGVTRSVHFLRWWRVFFARFKWEGRDQFLEAKSLEELRGVVEERLRYYHGHGRSPYLGGRLHSGLGYRTPKEVMDEVLGQSAKGITREAG
ncbi:hypothetical protein TNMX_11020 [Thermus sp. NMX2.A1]|nr:hypothetical protein TNMX_11020 [Thermus sp. NMX2.A1]